MFAPTPTFNNTEDDLQQELFRWHNRLAVALSEAENQIRHEKDLPRKRFLVFIPGSPTVLLQLLTWKVWCRRYHVTPELLITLILKRYAYRRRTNDSCLSFGLTTSHITSDTCRQDVEVELQKLYPNRENQQAEHSPVPLPISPQYKNLTEMLYGYNQTMLQRHRQSVLTHTASRRPWRQ